jgi:hypothetical protein
MKALKLVLICTLCIGLIIGIVYLVKYISGAW